jgi:hypothetical protein
MPTLKKQLVKALKQFGKLYPPAAALSKVFKQSDLVLDGPEGTTLSKAYASGLPFLLFPEDEGKRLVAMLQRAEEMNSFIAVKLNEVLPEGHHVSASSMNFKLVDLKRNKCDIYRTRVKKKAQTQEALHFLETTQRHVSWNPLAPPEQSPSWPSENSKES